LQRFTLSTPIRWAAGCPLERVVAKALLFDDALIDSVPQGEVRIRALEPQAWESHPELTASVYELLCAAHYRTSPLDLRRMMDAPGQHFTVAETDDAIAGALWLVDEGGLTTGLSRPSGRDFGAHAVTLSPSLWRHMAALLWLPRSRADGSPELPSTLLASVKVSDTRLFTAQNSTRIRITCRSVLAIPMSFGISGSSAVLYWYEWAATARPAAVVIRRWHYCH
jgi:hypothetical protein